MSRHRSTDAHIHTHLMDMINNYSVVEQLSHTGRQKAQAEGR